MTSPKTSPRSGVAELRRTVDKKLFVLHSSVFEDDSRALFGFKDNDVVVTKETHAHLERLSSGGRTDIANNARQVIRTIDEIFNDNRLLMVNGVSLKEISSGTATGKIFFQIETLRSSIPKDISLDEADRSFIETACAIQKARQQYTNVVLVAKRSHVRKAALAVKDSGLDVEDYLNDKVLLNDSDVLPTGYYELTPEQFDEMEFVESRGKGTRATSTYYWPRAKEVCRNEGIFFPDGRDFVVVGSKPEEDLIYLRPLLDFMHSENAVEGVTALDKIQSLALSHLMDPNIDVVILMGDVGGGKTLLATAAGYAQTRRSSVQRAPVDSKSRQQGQEKTRKPRDTDLYEKVSERGSGKMFGQFVLTRSMTSAGGENERLGFLKGGMADKFGPWVQMINDATLKIGHLSHQTPNEDEDGMLSLNGVSMVSEPLAVMGGRTFPYSWIMFDEIQDATRKIGKMALSRMGEYSKFVGMGNLAQINSEQVDERSSALTHMVTRLRGEPRFAFVILKNVYRSHGAELSLKL